MSAPLLRHSPLLPALLLAALACPGAGAGEQPAVEEWPAESLRWAVRSREKLSEAVFDLIHDVALIKLGAGDGRIDVRAGRNVYDNHDVAGSWSVVDHCNLRLTHPLIPATDFASARSGNFYASFHVDATLGVQFTGIRQVRPGALPQPTIAAAEAQAALAAQPESEGEPAFAGLGTARYGRLWNILAFPCRAPFKPEWHRRMADGEVISWNTYGTVELGPSLGWDLDFSGAFNTLAADLSFRTFVYGGWRVSVLREDARHVRVKVARTRSYGHRFSIGAGTSGLEVDFGVADVRVGATAIYPFVYSADRQRGTTFEVAYRYDLDDERGRAAYAAAIWGRLAASDRLAADPGGAGAPVRRLGDRQTRFRSTGDATRSRYAILYRHRHQTRASAADIIFNDGSGPITVFRASADNHRSWRWIWGDAERVDQDVRIDVDRDRHRDGDADALSLVLSGDIDDTDTDGVELHRYSVEAENAVGRPGFFPRPPVWRPAAPVNSVEREFDRRSRDRAPSRQPHAYGRSSFFWQATFSQEQVQRFLATDPARMWSLLETAFDRPPGAWRTPWARWRFAALHLPATVANLPGYMVNLHLDTGSMLASAERAHALWRAAQGATAIDQRLTLLAELFSDRRHASELSRLPRLALIGEPVAYVIQGTAHPFGTRRGEGAALARADPLPEYRVRLLAFDQASAHAIDDAEARVLSTNLTPLGGCRWRLEVHSAGDAPPAALFVRLIERRPWRVPRTLGETVLLREPAGLTAGITRLETTCGDGPLGALFARIISGNHYEVQIAVSRDGRRWGALGGIEFGPVGLGVHVEPHAPATSGDQR